MKKIISLALTFLMLLGVLCIPMNAAGKILKYKMREDAIEKYGLQKANSVETA